MFPLCTSYHLSAVSSLTHCSPHTQEQLFVRLLPLGWAACFPLLYFLFSSFLGEPSLQTCHLRGSLGSVGERQGNASGPLRWCGN